MKVYWPQGLAAAGLLASGSTAVKRSFFSRRPAWLTRRLSHDYSSVAASSQAAAYSPQPGAPSSISLLPVRDGQSSRMFVACADSKQLLQGPAQSAGSGSNMAAAAPPLFHGLRVSCVTALGLLRLVRPACADI
jgi:hypothetical protein